MKENRRKTMKTHSIICMAAALTAISANAQEITEQTQQLPQNLFMRSAEVTPNGKFASLNFGESGSAAWDLDANAFIEHGTTFVSGITNDGTMVGQKDGMPVYGTEGNWTQLYVNEGMYGMAEAVTPDGKYICGWIDSDIEPGSTQAVVWNIEENDRYYALGDLDLTEYGHGVMQSRAISISDDGKTITGNYISVNNYDNVAAVWVLDENTGEYIEKDIHKGYLTNTDTKGKYIACDAAKVSPDGTWVGGTFYGNVLDRQTGMQHLPFAYNMKEDRMYFYIWSEDVYDNQLMDIADDGTVYCIGGNYGGISNAVATFGTPQSEQLVTLQEHFESMNFDFEFQPNGTVPACVNADNSHIVLYTVDDDYNKAVHSIVFGKNATQHRLAEQAAATFDSSTGTLHVTAPENGTVLTATDMTGRTVLHKTLTEGSHSIGFSFPRTGVYIIKVNDSCSKIIIH